MWLPLFIQTQTLFQAGLLCAQRPSCSWKAKAVGGPTFKDFNITTPTYGLCLYLFLAVMCLFPDQDILPFFAFGHAPLFLMYPFPTPCWPVQSHSLWKLRTSQSARTRTLEKRGESISVFQATDVMLVHKMTAATALLSVYFLLLIIKARFRHLPAFQN